MSQQIHLQDQHIMSSYRHKLVDWVKAQLTGRSLQSGEEVNFSPLERYVSAVLFPVDREGIGLDPVGELELESDEITSLNEYDGNQENESDEVEPVKRRRYVPPSSVGFSFYMAESDWQIQLIATAKRFVNPNRIGFDENRDEQGRYTSTYQIESLSLVDESIVINQTGEYPIFEIDDKALAKFDVRAVRYGDGFIITVSLINNQELEINYNVDKAVLGKHIKHEQTQKTLFDVTFSCVIDKGIVGDYPTVDYALLSESEQEIELQYSHKKVYAVGHGAAVNWQVDGRHKVHEIMADFMPIQEVPQVTADLSDKNLEKVLSMEFLSQTEHQTQAVCDELFKFITLYEHWINGQSEALISIEAKHQSAGKRLVGRMQNAYRRMQSGIELIRQDSQVATAFADANRAMAMQMKHPSKSWRAFQLAFILTALVSVTYEDDEFRNTVDLIWFPTGGGKTEAYLGLTAYQILYRRLRYKQSGGGTTVLMRYTLKLLTTQQFLRACRLICALELIRREKEFDFGQETISIGLWVGDSASPNTVQKAQQLFVKAKQNKDFSYFVLEKCPWCDTPFNEHNFQTDGQFYFICTNTQCYYSGLKLPCQIVDEMLYKTPPTLLLATIDKLAILAWEERSSVFFGERVRDIPNRPPELIIQDELHLIANALGSVAGIYESALQTVLASRYVKPKYIASTATIKEAQSQVQRLFAKDLAIFPPQGLSTEDAFFAKTVDLSIRAGRLYVGYFAPLLNRQKNLAPLAGLLLLAPFVCFGHHQDEYEAWLDAWWTQLVYHGSLKGVGNSHTSFDSAVRKRYEQYVKEFFKAAGLYDNDKEKQKRIDTWLQEQGFDINFYQEVLLKKIEQRIRPSIKQLTSNSTASENARIFNQLDLKCHEDNMVDVVLATNMVATGLDVARLALMVINGQPITTAEYIQASSRVGRSDVAGVVFVNYYRDQARSLSHYENFYPYHQSFYRYVEPTSVTPYTYQARCRALHAALVISLRHGSTHLLGNDRARYLNLNEEQTIRIIDILKDYCAKADPERADTTLAHIDKLLEEWQNYRDKNKTEFRQTLYYYNSQKGTASLLRHHGQDKNGLWETLTNMRNVEHSGILKLS